MKQKLAIIGTGISGMGCGYHLHQKYDLTFFEKNDYIGGHTNTISIQNGHDPVMLDTGFMVFNSETYPNLCKLFSEIKAPIKKTDMSFSVQHKPSGLEFSGSGIMGLLSQPRNLFSISYIRMLLEISRFNRISVDILDKPEYEDYSLTDYIKEFGFSDDMLKKYLIPMSSAVWSTPADKMMHFPAVTLIRFFKNHGFLGLNTRHQWYTLHNGSQSYRELLIRPFKDRIRTHEEVREICRENGKVKITTDAGSEVFDKVIIATHADQALRMLADATDNEKRLLAPFKYQVNIATVHQDESVMPANKKTWSSWNYLIDEVNGKLVPTTVYWMNSLQHVSRRNNYFVSINALNGSIAQEHIIKEIIYEHPLFDADTLHAQHELHSLNENGLLFFCGSYFKNGFHEDAYKSALDVCRKL